MDRALYKKHMQETLANYPNLHVRSGSVFDLLFNQSTYESKAQPSTICPSASPGATLSNSDRQTGIAGVQLGIYSLHILGSWTCFKGAVFCLGSGQIITCSQVVICTGTFLSGEIHIGTWSLLSTT
jgi:tRNA uridine 5-carboxymethylaminomethyl modification enzyme